MTTIEEIASKLLPIEQEWLRGWEGPTGAAFNAVADGLAKRGFTISSTNWDLSERGLALRNYLKENAP